MLTFQISDHSLKVCPSFNASNRSLINSFSLVHWSTLSVCGLSHQKAIFVHIWKNCRRSSGDGNMVTKNPWSHAGHTAKKICILLIAEAYPLKNHLVSSWDSFISFLAISLLHKYLVTGARQQMQYLEILTYGTVGFRLPRCKLSTRHLPSYVSSYQVTSKLFYDCYYSFFSCLSCCLQDDTGILN